ncbi:hypothetical protein EDD85DRAFT_796490 [Armillaria nabsnona]|nr:hypothetical protein EDD85DRAFT_796490 [Armillaria nabsnona]
MAPWSIFRRWTQATEGASKRNNSRRSSVFSLSSSSWIQFTNAVFPSTLVNHGPSIKIKVWTTKGRLFRFKKRRSRKEDEFTFVCPISGQPPDAPVFSLPTELLFQIFEECCFSEHPHTILRLSMVCSRWRDVSLSLPHIWSTIGIPIDVQPRKILKKQRDIVDLYLQRSNTSPLSIILYSRSGAVNRETMRAFVVWFEPLITLLRTHAHRWRTIDVRAYFPTGSYHHLFAPGIDMKMLESLRVHETDNSFHLHRFSGFSTAAKLQTVHASKTPFFAQGSTTFPASQIRTLVLEDMMLYFTTPDIVASFPNATDLTIIPHTTVHGHNRFTTSSIRHAGITCLTLSVLCSPIQLTDIMSRMELPNLRTLILVSGPRTQSRRRFDASCIEHLFRHSGNSLRHLIIDRVPIQSGDIAELVRKIHGLEKLVVRESDFGQEDEYCPISSSRVKRILEEAPHLTDLELVYRKREVCEAAVTEARVMDVIEERMYSHRPLRGLTMGVGTAHIFAEPSLIRSRMKVLRDAGLGYCS